MEVSLVSYPKSAYEMSVASARTCYAKTPVLPDEVSRTKKKRALRDAIAESTLSAGHLTTRQHANFTFLLTGVSRGAIWSFLHSHPHYNSEQVSQRYVPVSSESFVSPPGMSAQGSETWSNLVDYQIAAYQDMIEVLTPSITKAYFNRFPAREKNADAHALAIKRQCMEDARYLLPLGMTANLYHTVSALTLLRYVRLARFNEFASETLDLTTKMLNCVLEVDPLFEKDVQKVSDGDTPYALDGELSVPWCPNGLPKLLKGRSTKLLKVSSDVFEEEAQDAMDPSKNPLIMDSLGLYSMDRGTQALEFIHLTYLKSISLTADAQSQRHRAIRRYQPALPLEFPLSDRILTPFKVRRDPTASVAYAAHVERIVELGSKFQEADPGFIRYGFPNGATVQFTETGSLLGFYHRWKSRLCLLAQDEIRESAEEEIRQAKEHLPLDWVGAPCHIRNWGGVTPRCPEGNRFCGVPLWKFEVGKSGHEI